VRGAVQKINSESRKEVHYANVFQISHNEFEFLLELGQQEDDIHTRIYLCPKNASVLSDLLRDTLERHEWIFGNVAMVYDE
jgi:hypothetical protein